MNCPVKRTNLEWTNDAYTFLWALIEEDSSEKNLEDFVFGFINVYEIPIAVEDLVKSLKRLICKSKASETDFWNKVHFAFVFRVVVNKTFQKEITGTWARLVLDEDRKILKLSAPNGGIIRNYTPPLDKREDQEPENMEIDPEVESKPDFSNLRVPDLAIPEEENQLENQVFFGYEVLNHVFELANNLNSPDCSEFLKDVERGMKKPELKDKIIYQTHITEIVQKLLDSVVKNSTFTTEFEFVSLKSFLRNLKMQLLDFELPNDSSISQLLTQAVDTYDKKLIVPVKKVRLALENFVDELFR